MIEDKIPGTYYFGPSKGMESRRVAHKLADDVEGVIGTRPKVMFRSIPRRYFVIHTIGS